MAQVSERVGASRERARSQRVPVPPSEPGSVMEWLVAGGLAGGLAGLLLSVVVPSQDMMPMVAALYGLEGVVWGWVFHLLHSIAFGVIFAIVARAVRGVTEGAGELLASSILGAVYGALTWLIFAAFVMPTWIGAVTDMAPPTPDWNTLSLVAHVVYGAALGVLLPVLASVSAQRNLR